jgi:hypothetical protein
VPAIKNLTVNSVSGSDESNPNFPATDADAQRAENIKPEMMKREEWDKDAG